MQASGTKPAADQSLSTVTIALLVFGEIAERYGRPGETSHPARSPWSESKAAILNPETAGTSGVLEYYRTEKEAFLLLWTEADWNTATLDENQAFRVRFGPTGRPKLEGEVFSDRVAAMLISRTSELANTPLISA